MRNEDNHELIKKVLLETMDEFHKFCEDNNLTYYLVGGGLIGAIRHKGLIPWDDDLDVIMPKEDFDKLQELSSKFSSPIKLSNYFLDKDYYRCCAALVNNSLKVDTGGHENNITGVSLDILCLHPTFSNKFLLKAHFKSTKLCRGLLIVKGKVYLRNKYSFVTNKTLSLASHLMKFVPKSKLIKLLNTAEQIKLGDSEVFANLHGAWGVREVVTVDMLRDRELYDFDGRQYWSMTYDNAHKWLTNVYGDYMKLPPENERQYRHIAKLIKVNNKHD